MGRITQQFATDGFAIWMKGNQSNYNFDIHINEWIQPKDKTYIDIGIRLYDSKQLKECFIYVPYNFSTDELIDLSLKLANENIARGIFNANCLIKSSSNSPITEIEYNGRKENIINLSATQNKIKKMNNGTLLIIDFTDIVSLLVHEESYIRFRIPHKTLSTFFKTKKYNYKFQFEIPVMTQRYNYVIKLNEVRSLPFEIRSIFPTSEQTVKKL